MLAWMKPASCSAEKPERTWNAPLNSGVILKLGLELHQDIFKCDGSHKSIGGSMVM